LKCSRSASCQKQKSK